MPTQSATTQKDPVCGMQVDTTKAAASSEFAGKKYYFCSAGCKAKFDKKPDEFVGSEGPKNSGGGSCCG